MINPMRSLEKAYQKINFHYESNLAKIGDWLDRHPKINTIVVIANHIFRALGMLALFTVMPGSFLAKCAIMLGASLFYRITIERFCHFRFAIPACLGGMAMELSIPALANIINGAAIQSFASLGTSLIAISPLVLYLAGIVWISHSPIQELIKKKKAQDNPCCCEP